MLIRAISPRTPCAGFRSWEGGEPGSDSPSFPHYSRPGKSVTFFMLQVLLPGFMAEEVMHPYLVGNDDGYKG